MPRTPTVFALDTSRWPSGIARSAAMFSVTPEELTARAGVVFEAGVDGLDYYRAVGLELPSGRRVHLVWNERAPVLGLQLDADGADDLVAAREETMATLRLMPSELMWSPDPSAPAS